MRYHGRHQASNIKDHRKKTNILFEKKQHIIFEKNCFQVNISFECFCEIVP